MEPILPRVSATQPGGMRGAASQAAIRAHSSSVGQAASATIRLRPYSANPSRRAAMPISLARRRSTTHLVRSSTHPAKHLSLPHVFVDPDFELHR